MLFKKTFGRALITGLVFTPLQYILFQVFVQDTLKLGFSLPSCVVLRYCAVSVLTRGLWGVLIDDGSSFGVWLRHWEGGEDIVEPVIVVH